MSKQQYTILESKGSQEILLESRNDQLWIDQNDLTKNLGWTLKPEGLCKEEICVPVNQLESLSSEGQINLMQFAQELDRPLATEFSKNVVFLGESANDRSLALYSQQAPEIKLPDLNGNLHNLSEHFGKKLCLVVHASW